MKGYDFSANVRTSLMEARNEAARLQHEYVGPEHLLLGLVATQGSVAVDILQKLSISLDAIRREVDQIVKPGKSDVEMPNMPYTSRAKKALELAMREAHELDHSYVGTEHLLLALIREEGGMAAFVLRDLGLTLDRVRDEVRRHPTVLSRPQRDHPGESPLAGNVLIGTLPPNAHPWMRRAYAILAFGVMLLGLVHLLATFRFFQTLSQSAMWFASAGLLLIVTGALNLLNRKYGWEAPGLRMVTIATNVVVTTFGAMAGIAGRAAPVEIVFVVGLTAGVTLLSLTATAIERALTSR